MPQEYDRYTSMALALCYVVSAAVILAVYKEPLVAMARDVARWMPKRRFVSARSIGGKLGRDIREAIDDAG